MIIDLKHPITHEWVGVDNPIGLNTHTFLVDNTYGPHDICWFGRWETWLKQHKPLVYLLPYSAKLAIYQGDITESEALKLCPSPPQ